MGSLIKLFTPSPRFTDEHNALVAAIPPHVLELLFAIKRAYRPEWGEDWRSHVSVSWVNGRPGNRRDRACGRPGLSPRNPRQPAAHRARSVRSRRCVTLPGHSA